MKRILALILFHVSLSTSSSPFALKNAFGDSRIIGGKEVKPRYSFPHQVSFQSDTSKHICGGAILNEVSILTAGHCFDGVTNVNTQVKAGLHKLSGIAPQVVKVKKLTRHSNFSYETARFDIGMIILEESLVFNEKVEKVDLYDDAADEPGPAKLTGWGSTSFPNHGEISNTLQVVEGNIINVEDCKNIYHELNIDWSLNEGHFCFGGDGLGFCGGDAGGPLICKDGKLCGIASWGFECGVEKYPGVFTKVKEYAQWINDNIANP